MRSYQAIFNEAPVNGGWKLVCTRKGRTTPVPISKVPSDIGMLLVQFLMAYDLAGDALRQLWRQQGAPLGSSSL